VALWNRDGRPVDRAVLQRAVQSQAHRGPDDEGYVLIDTGTGQFGLVHWQTVAAARYARARSEGRPAADLLGNRKKDPSDDAGNGIRYADSTRHHVEVEHWSYRKKLQRWAKTLG